MNALPIVLLLFLVIFGSVGAVSIVMIVRSNTPTTQAPPAPPPASQVVPPQFVAPAGVDQTPGLVPAGTTTLPVSQMVAPNGAVVDGTLRVTYPAKSFASAGGIAKTLPISPTSSATLKYQVMFEKGFCWGGTSQGGKLPGLLFNAPGAACGAGGNWCATAGSFRPMWGKQGFPYAYVYYAKNSSSVDMKDQTPEYAKVAKDSGKTGHSLFKTELPALKVDGSWNDITVAMTLNAVGKMDGTLSLTVNGKTRTFKNMMWRLAPDQLIRGVAINSFHGGGSSAWSCPTNTYSRFKNFTLSVA